jgi:hypothetical protein
VRMLFATPPPPGPNVLLLKAILTPHGVITVAPGVSIEISVPARPEQRRGPFSLLADTADLSYGRMARMPLNEVGNARSSTSTPLIRKTLGPRLNLSVFIFTLTPYTLIFA